ncbi:MAG TPA: shikimate dehydrogenase [Candidatus Limnocylindria bacterium]|nr:shikimate dehydrogenase [Candidatus Limnocylindria bacterium]
MTDLVVLLGHRIGYSASPAMHNAAFAALGIDARYELADVAVGGLAKAVEALRGEDRIGANVTQPHKLAVCDLVDHLAPEAERLGAANTIVRDGTRLVAHNTDLPALAAELADMGAGGPSVILGVGGASRAAQAALADAGTTVSLVDRSRWGSLAEVLAEAALLVNATPIGTGSDESPVPAGLLRPDLAVLDLVYRPSPTRLVRDARAAGARARGGAGMLLRQAALSFALWTGREAPIGVMRDALRAELGA